MTTAKRLAMVFLAVPLLLGLPQPARAKTIKVGNGTAASCTEAALRSALVFAGGERSSTIQFKCGVEPVTITVTATMTIPDNTTIDGNGLIILDGQFGPASILRVDRDTTVTLRNLTIDGGGGECFTCEMFGGGLFNEGTVTVRGCTFSRNIASSGGGIFNHGTLSVFESTFSGNDALSGGGIFNDGTLTVKDSTFTENQAFDGGGGIYSQGTLVIHSSTFAGNGGGGQTPPSGVGGGGIFAQGTLNVADSAFYGNHAQLGGALWVDTGVHTVSKSTITQNGPAESGGGIFIWFDAVLTLKDSTIAQNFGGFGGGIYNQFSSLVVKKSTITGNRGLAGGGIFSGGTLTVNDSTITNNTVSEVGGGIASGGRVTVKDSRISKNSATDGGGVFTYDGGTPPTLTHTIVESNTPNDVAP